MGGYGSKPITEKVSEGGEFTKKNITVIYGATAMQGWRIAMEVSDSLGWKAFFLYFYVKNSNKTLS